ncbi:FKBP-type peptidyl-prolyl cis-trans isomerase, partial [Campylobacter concisus]|uniref:FKBP-type peptidyl-prolyl cis-trans isomerase n=1 Tax=Campylobacter concisus TaxID=199 RepID=UPI0015E18A02
GPVWRLTLLPRLAERLMRMRAGEKFKFVIPPELAFGDSGMEGIPGGETIVFEIGLIKVLKPGELAEAARKIHEKEQNEGVKKPH